MLDIRVFGNRNEQLNVQLRSTELSFIKLDFNTAQSINFIIKPNNL